MSNQNPFEDRSELDLNSNPFDPPSSSTQKNPFQHPNDTAYSLDLQDSERGLGQDAPQSSGYGFSGPQKSFAEREAELRAREDRVRQREEDLGMKENNWPPFFPFIHHKITGLPEAHQRVTTLLYTQWLALAATLILNLVGCILLLIAGSSEGGADTGSAGGYLIFILPVSFITWYRPIYLGFSRTEGKAMAFFFYLYFVFGGFNLAYAAYMAIGIPSTGSAGLINTIAMFSQKHIVAAVFGLLTSIGWILQFVGGGILYQRVWHYKNGNADISFQEATNTFKINSIKTVLLHQSKMTSS